MNMNLFRSIIFMVAFLTFTAVSSASSLYFTGTSGPTIWVGDTDGATPATVLFSGTDAEPGGSAQGPVGIVASQGELFWGTGNHQQVIRGNADGTGIPSALANSDPAGSHERHDVAIDRANNRYFFTGSWSGLFVANLDGSGSPSNIIDPANGFLTSVAYDAENDFLYYSSDDGDIGKVRPDGSDAAIVHTGLNGIRDIAVDFANGLIYYVDLDIVGTVNLDGTGTSTTLFDPDYNVRSIDIDLLSQNLFWVAFTDSGGVDFVQRGSADGSGSIQTLYSGYFDSLRGIAVQQNRAQQVAVGAIIVNLLYVILEIE